MEDEKKPAQLEVRDVAHFVVVRGVTIDFFAFRIVSGKLSTRLTAAEAKLLSVLLASANQLIRHEDLVAALHAKASLRRGHNRVKFTIQRLREKLGRARRCLESVHGQGYLLNLTPETQRETGARKNNTRE